MLNAVVLQCLCIEAAVKRLAADGFPATDGLLAARLVHRHGRRGLGLRQLCDPHGDDETGDGEGK
ncbi:hypothetical protein ACFXOM_18735 [Streptomyces sp. NPDC059169]|uniref:hypothetical protein n=1 Tax=Streptomyces sp. NPDC059169 TaxID=3346754 RepID=UPI0036B0E226